MKFVVISDTHGRHREVRNLPKADVIIHAGDITYRGWKSEVEDFLKWFGGLPYQYKIFISGNHDFFLERKNTLIEGMLPKGVIYLNDSGIHLDGIKVWGSPVTPWFYNWAFNKTRGKEIARHWELIPNDTDLLITHGPPFGILDTVLNQNHTGCKDLLKKVLEVRPAVHAFGHIHESYGSIKRNETLFINSCLLNERYEMAFKPITFQLP